MKLSGSEFYLRAMSYVVESDEDGFKVGTQLKSFHYQAKHRVSDRGLFVGFLMLWLKKGIVPSLPKEAIAIDMVYPAVLLTYGQSFGHLPDMICSLLNGLRELHTEFSEVETIVNNEGKTIYKTPNSPIELLYMYLMIWLTLYCPSLMTALTSEDPTYLLFVEQYENSDWTSHYMSAIRKILHSHQNYQIYCNFFEFPDGNYGNSFQDI